MGFYNLFLAEVHWNVFNTEFTKKESKVSYELIHALNEDEAREIADENIEVTDPYCNIDEIIIKPILTH